MKWAVAAVAFLLAGCAEPALPANADGLLDGRPVTLLVATAHNLTVTDEGLQQFIAALASLSGQDVAVARGSASAAPRVWTLENLTAFSESAGGRGRTDAVEVRLFVLPGLHLVEGEPAAGLTLLGDETVFLFPDAISVRLAQANASDAQRGLLEAVVLTHEAGHVAGLVGCGLAMVRPHDDPEHACHSANATSIMHWRVARMADWGPKEGWDTLGPFGWDTDDLADVAAGRTHV